MTRICRCGDTITEQTTRFYINKNGERKEYVYPVYECGKCKYQRRIRRRMLNGKHQEHFNNAY